MTPSPLSAAGRARRAELDAASGAAHAVMKEHQAVCYACRPGSDFAKRACPRGWELAKAAHDAAMAYRAFLRDGRQVNDDLQGRLW